MFRNLEAEQSRKGMTNQEVAGILGISRVSYERKKKNGKFNRAEIVILLTLFECDFWYLFATAEEQKSA